MIEHWSDCAVHNEPATPNGDCNCGGFVATQNIGVTMTDPLDFNDVKDQEDDLALDDLPGQTETEVLFQRVFDAFKEFIRDYRTTLTGQVSTSEDPSLIIVHGKDNNEDEG